MELEKLELSQGLDQLAQDRVKVKRDSLQCFKQELSQKASMDSWVAKLTLVPNKVKSIFTVDIHQNVCEKICMDFKIWGTKIKLSFNLIYQHFLSALAHAHNQREL